MTANHRWGKIKEDLKASSSRDFEQKVLPLLRIRWPNLVTPSAMAYLDRAGIDHCFVGGGKSLAVVIQCKGFKVQEGLGKSQLSQIRKSIKSFLKSALTCEHYVLLYNRQGLDREFAKQVEVELASLVLAKKTKTAELWDLDQLQKQLNSDLMQRLVLEVKRLSAELSDEERSRFSFGRAVVRDVPHKIGELTLKQHAAPVVSLSDESQSGDPVAVLGSARSLRRWTLVLGLFGAGKSTLARRLTVSADHALIYVPAAQLRHLGASENALAESIVDYLGIFESDSHYTDEERAHLYWLAGPLMAALMRETASKSTLIIDGLDEHRAYSTMRGLQQLMNELSRANCQVILTTRQEHFFDHYATYTDSLGKGSRHSNETLQLMELRHWELPQITEFLAQATGSAPQPQKSRLEEFGRSVGAGDVDLSVLRHPLFLAMTADLVAQEGIGIARNQADLFCRWTREKLMRDFRTADRAVPQGYENSDLLVHTMLHFMADVALLMTEAKDGIVELKETIPEAAIREAAQQRFGVPVPTEIYSVTSFLQPVRRRAPGGSMLLSFFHRSFHEFFVAYAICARSLAAEGYPAGILQLVEELHSVLADSARGDTPR